VVSGSEKPKRHSLATLEAQLAKRREKIEKSEREIVELALREDTAAAKSLREDPSRSAFTPGAAAAEARRKRESREKALDHLHQEARLLESQIGEEMAEQAREELEKAEERMKSLAAFERNERVKAGKAFGNLVDLWNRLARILEARSQLAAEVKGARLLERIGSLDPEASARWDELSAFVLTPVPTTIECFLDELVEGATSGRPDDDQPEQLDELNRQRAALSLPAEVRPVPPLAATYAEIYPDLRGKIETAAVHPGAAPIRRRIEASWPGEAA
jgi:hypothetical protein